MHIEQHADWYQTRFPAGIASYWGPTYGITNLQRDMHLISKCPGGANAAFVTTMWAGGL